MKSLLVIVTPIVLVAILAGLIYMYKTGMMEEMLTQTETETETASSLPEEEAAADTAQKLSEVDSTTAEGLSQARDIVRASLEAQKREELKRQQSESMETARKKRLYKSMDGWLKRTD